MIAIALNYFTDKIVKSRKINLMILENSLDIFLISDDIL